eukprot:gene1188-1756_t
MKFKTPDGEEVKIDFRQHVKEQHHEADHHNPDHSNLVLRCDVDSLVKFLLHSGVDISHLTFYDGGCSRRAGLSHAIHIEEDLIMKKDGWLRTANEIKDLQRKMFDKTSEERVMFRENMCRARIRNQRFPLKSLDDFNAIWEREPRIEFTVGGPFTPLLALGEKYKKLSEKPGTLVAMACAWKGDENLLKDNFNNQVDIDAAEAVLVEQKVFPNLRRIILTTETCKVGWLTVSAEEIRERTGWGSLADLVGLWNCFQATQAPLFDVAVSFALDRPDAVPFELLPARLTTIADEASLAQRRIEVCEVHPTTGCFVHEEHQKRPEAAEGGFAEVYSSTIKYEHSSDAEVDSKLKELATEAAKTKFLDYLASAYASRLIYRPWWKKITARL